MYVALTGCLLSLHAAHPPCITTHPQGIKDAVPGTLVTFSAEANGTEPLNYQWQHEPKDGSGGWQSCNVEGLSGVNSSILTIPNVQKSNEGSYRCTVSNYTGSQATKSCKLEVSYDYPKELEYVP